MTTSESLLMEQLVEVVENLTPPVNSRNDLFLLLKNFHGLLPKVKKCPPSEEKFSIVGCLRAFVSDEYKCYVANNEDVKVAVVSCICHIMEIIYPQDPYEDNEMKHVLKLIVSSFETLSDDSSKLLDMRTSILKNVLRVRLHKFMLDLQCEDLFLQMFKLFLKEIRDHHYPGEVFSFVEIIMTRALIAACKRGSKDTSEALITLILASAEKCTEEYTPIAKKLVEKVLQYCAKPLRSYFKKAIKAKKSSPQVYIEVIADMFEGTVCDSDSDDDEKVLGQELQFSRDIPVGLIVYALCTLGLDYSKLNTSTCEGSAGDAGHNDANACREQLTEGKMARASSEGPAQADENKLAVVSADDAAQETVCLPKSVSKSAKDEGSMEEVRKTNFKRKCATGIEKETVCLPKSLSKSAKDEGPMEQVPKRKCATGIEKVT